MLVLDTNILINNKAKKGIITYPVLRELDALKNKEGALGAQARDAILNIYKNPEKFPLVYEEVLPNEHTDDFLIRYAENNDLELLTLDLSMHLKAQSLKVKSKYASNGNNHYTGVTYLTDTEMSNLLSGTFSKSFPTNHFLIHEKRAFIKTEGDIAEIGYHSIDSVITGAIKPRNIEQYCVAELLHRKVPIVSVSGKVGSGKSYTLLNYALTELDRGKIDKLVYCPVNAFVRDTLEVAALPGDLLSKNEHLLGPLIDLLGPARIRYYVEQEMIEVLPIAVARGRSFNKAILYISEAQNISEDHLMLLISRLGENSRLFVDGDHKGQIDKKVFENKNGMKLLMRLADSEEAARFGTVKLTKIERSANAQLAEVLDRYR